MIFLIQCKTATTNSTINESEFRDRVYACWLGKNIGGTLGIIYGTAIIPEKWKAPIGDGIVTVAVSGFEVPPTLQALTDKTFLAQKKVAELYHSTVKITSDKTSLSDQKQLSAIDKTELSMIWNRSPYVITRNTVDLSFICDYDGSPEIQTGEYKVLKLSIGNKTNSEKSISLSLQNVPDGYSLSGLPEGQIKISPQSKYDISLSFKALPEAKGGKFIAEINDAGTILDMQLAIISPGKSKSTGDGN